jgi:hypothetical protein
VQLAFKDGTFTTTPIPLVLMTYSDDAAISPLTAYVEYRPTVDVSTTTALWKLTGVTPTAGKTYSFVGHILGI